VPVTAPVAWLDRWARLYWDRRESIGSYRAFGTLGFAAGLAVVLAAAAAAATGAPHAVTVAVVVAVPLSFLLGVKISQLLFGYERIVFFEQALFALGVVALVLLVLGLRREIPRGLDLAALGIGVFLGFGRGGCFMVGCCHGHPSLFGIRYRDEHARAGLPWYLVGRPLFPIQLVDGAVSFTAVAVAVAVARAPGALAATYLLVYSAARFTVEWLRGDPQRPRFAGLPEAQWTATLLAVAVAGVTRSPLAAAVAAPLAACTFALVLARRRLARSVRGMTNPWHLQKIHQLLVHIEARAAADESRVLRTSQSLCVSLRTIEGVRDYVLSRADALLDRRAVNVLLCHLSFRRALGERVELRAGAMPGVVHVLVQRGAPLSLAERDRGERA
jgi:hypothetical protein